MSVPYSGMIGLTPSKPLEEEEPDEFSFNSYLDALFGGSSKEHEYGYNATLQDESLISASAGILTSTFGDSRPPPRDKFRESLSEDHEQDYVAKEDEWWYRTTAKADQQDALAMKSLDLENSDSNFRLGDSFRNNPSMNPAKAASPFGPPRHEPSPKQATEQTQVIQVQSDVQDLSRISHENPSLEHAREAARVSAEYQRMHRDAAEAERGPGDWLWGLFQTVQADDAPDANREDRDVQVRAVHSRYVHPAFGYAEDVDGYPSYSEGQHSHMESTQGSLASATAKPLPTFTRRDPEGELESNPAPEVQGRPVPEVQGMPVAEAQGRPVPEVQGRPTPEAQGINFEVQVSRYDTAGQIRDRVAKAAGLPSSSIALAIGGHILHDDAVPALYEAAATRHDTMLTVVAAPPPHAPPQSAPPQRATPPHAPLAPPHHPNARVAEAAAAAAVAATPWLQQSAAIHKQGSMSEESRRAEEARQLAADLAESKIIEEAMVPPKPDPKESKIIQEAMILEEAAKINKTMGDTIASAKINKTMGDTMGSTFLEDTQSIQQAMAALTAELERREIALWGTEMGAVADGKATALWESEMRAGSDAGAKLATNQPSREKPHPEVNQQVVADVLRRGALSTVAEDDEADAKAEAPTLTLQQNEAKAAPQYIAAEAPTPPVQESEAVEVELDPTETSASHFHMGTLQGSEVQESLEGVELDSTCVQGVEGQPPPKGN